MPSYDASRYDPPAPVAHVAIRSSAGGATVADVSLLIDTGADITLLPRSAITALGLSADPAVRYDVVGFDGSRATADAIELDMVFLGKAFRGRYLITDDSHGISAAMCLGCSSLHLTGRDRLGLKVYRSTLPRGSDACTAPP